jgi:hypothetical protein
MDDNKRVIPQVGFGDEIPAGSFHGDEIPSGSFHGDEIPAGSFH